jgi:putative restriction endonuclease
VRCPCTLPVGCSCLHATARWVLTFFVICGFIETEGDALLLLFEIAGAVSKAIFTTKIESTYDDLPEFRYHFPRTYLRQVEATLGDWIIYYEPRRISGDLGSRGGRQAYFATARVIAIQPDPGVASHFYAFVADFLQFDRPVPFREGDHYYEAGLRRADGGTCKGAFGRAVRPITDAEFDLIVRSGFQLLLAPNPLTEGMPTDLGIPGVAEEPATFERPIVERFTSRPFRDAAFSEAVKSAYHNACAVTGLKIVNGGGRVEVQAAHIRPVAASGPDSVRNGLALCSTVHWMFDRGLLSLDDDYTILIAEGRVPEPVKRLINPDGRLRLPPRPEFRPHPQFLRYHRKNVFRG